VYVAGDSMVEEKINDGDIVIFHPGLTEGNGIYVVSIGNTLVVKRVDFDTPNQTLILISANPAYPPPRQFSGPALEELRIAGRVLAEMMKTQRPGNFVRVYCPMSGSWLREILVRKAQFFQKNFRYDTI
jgi:SOS-response transcriptional repressor LexA